MRITPTGNEVHLAQIEGARMPHRFPDPSVASVDPRHSPRPAARQEVGCELVGTSDTTDYLADRHRHSAEVTPAHLAVRFDVLREAPNRFQVLRPASDHRGTSSSLLETPYGE